MEKKTESHLAIVLVDLFMMDTILSLQIGMKLCRWSQQQKGATHI